MKNVQQLEADVTYNFPTVERPLDLLCSTPCVRSLGHTQESLESCSKSDTSLHNTSLPIVEADDTVVDMIRCIEDDVRFDSSEQATECSSSFGETDIDDDYKETCGSGQSIPQNVPAPVMEDHDHVSTNRVRNTLSDDWKSYRRDIEWRCRWLELKINEFQSRVSCYDKKLKEIQSKKLAKDHAHFTKASAARAACLISHYHRQRILHRKTKKVGDVENFSTYVSQHPLFSLYEHRNSAADGRPVDDGFIYTPALMNTGSFLNHIQDPSSSNNSDIHKKPMGFSMIRKKIESHDYTSWKSFVDDFEHVCYDAMSYYRKHRVLWNAANNMLNIALCVEGMCQGSHGVEK